MNVNYTQEIFAAINGLREGCAELEVRVDELEERVQKLEAFEAMAKHPWFAYHPVEGSAPPLSINVKETIASKEKVGG